MSEPLARFVTVEVAGRDIQTLTENVLETGLKIACELDPTHRAPAEAMYVAEVEGKPTVICGPCADGFAEILGCLDGKP